jgi:hypothetical protein
VLTTEPKPDDDSFGVKTGYLEIMRSLERPVDPRAQREYEGEWTVRVSDMQLSADNIDSIKAAHRFLLREPERSRRVVKLLCANFLANVETPKHGRRKPAVRALLAAAKPMSVPLYPVSPDAPAGARALPPQELARWLVTTRDAKLQMLWQKAWPSDRLACRRAHRDLVIMLASELYHRERGTLPTSEEALVGNYLKSLPNDGSADLADETTPTVQ